MEALKKQKMPSEALKDDSTVETDPEKTPIQNASDGTALTLETGFTSMSTLAEPVSSHSDKDNLGLPAVTAAGSSLSIASDDDDLDAPTSFVPFANKLPNSRFPPGSLMGAADSIAVYKRHHPELSSVALPKKDEAAEADADAEAEDEEEAEDLPMGHTESLAEPAEPGEPAVPGSPPKKVTFAPQVRVLSISSSNSGR